MGTSKLMPLPEEIIVLLDQKFESLKCEMNDWVPDDENTDSIRSSLPDLIRSRIYNVCLVIYEDTLNQLMNEASSLLNDASSKIKNAFYKESIREKCKDEHEYQVDDLVFHASDRAKYSAATAGVSGLVIFAFLIKMLRISNIAEIIIAGLSGLAAGSATYKITYESDWLAQKDRERIRSEIKDYLDREKSAIKHFLQEVSAAFKSEFNEFLQDNEIEVDE